MARRMCLSFLALWMGLLILSLTNPYGLFPASSLVYFYILVFLLSFTLGITFSYNKVGLNKQLSFFSELKSSIDWIVDNRLVLIATILCDLFLLYAFSKQQVALMDSSIQELRLEGSQDYLFGDNGLLGSIYNLVVTPLSTFIQVLFAYIFICRREKLLPLVASLLNVILSTAINNSRGVLMIVLVYVVYVVFCCPFLINEGGKKIRFRNVVLIVVFALGAFAFVSYLTAQRLFGTNEISGEAVEMGVDALNKHIITYFVAPFRCFDYAIDHNYFEALGGPTFGRSTFGFFDGFIGFVLNHLGIHYTTANSIIYTHLQDKWIWVGIDMNFAYTAMFNFYMDFGFFGVLFLPAIFGAVIKKLCNSFLRNGNPALFLLLGYLFLALWESYFGWILYRWAVAFNFIFIIVFYYYYRSHKSKINKIQGFHPI